MIKSRPGASQPARVGIPAVLLLTLGPYASYLASPCLSFLIFTVRTENRYLSG